ncbi:excinuclease ABC subunit UvrA [Leadbettera azotonutricia]|uniref:UvrABC system protein A n=1 Tax=Leadbettera azotonutricia (strain ATCC BAA-888 / DSM 13862 / ZAS-9) TaxID=545695 RepID=F5YG84_LEAAZ|nr:excinuclease ABC subunit UvrA [Leadbettera azotonutricia]AEF81142.1 excinuclease ABC, A subunit [Leadbettera azotonutricia ZAS-9]
MDKLVIKGAREHNLKNIDLELPRDKLIVISGLSGSGKSSLAFDTIFAEGQRRYVESLSAYARQFLGRMDKPDLDYIEGLSPAISIEQKTTHRNPRSIVGTVTEIYDYYRLLYARIGIPHCPECGREIREQPVDQIIDSIMAMGEGAKIQLLAPVIRGKKGEHQKIVEDARKAGFARARIDGVPVNLDEKITLDKQKKHTIEIVVDRMVIAPEIRSRLAESTEAALEAADGIMLVLCQQAGDKSVPSEHFFSQKNACPDCGISIPELQPRLFSFNNPFGACPSCSGLGIKMEFDPNLVIPDSSLSFNEGGCVPYNPDSAWYRARFESLAKHYKFSLDAPFKDLPKKAMDAILYGSKDDIEIHYKNKEGTNHFDYNTKFQGILEDLRRRYLETQSPGIKEWLEKFMSQKPCEECGGRRLKGEVLGVTVGGRNIWDLTSLSVTDSLKFFETIKFNKTEKKIAYQILKEINARLGFMKNVGLDYLTLERKAATLSGGEAQRIRLATQIGSSLVGVLYILDEPSIGLHQRDNQRLIDTLLYLRNLGNTLIVVEHDEQTLRTADHIVDLGPGAGVHGGKVVAQGTPAEVMKVEESLTGQYLAGTLIMDVPEKRRQGNGNFLRLYGVKEHNLKNIDVEIPLGIFTCITGVSGSGKSTLLSDVLYPVLANEINNTNRPEGECDKIEGTEFIDKVIDIDQSPIGRTPRSNPATYVGVFTAIRDLFASLPDAKARGYKPGRFSFNVRGGRCENCEGDGTIRIEMNFLPDVYVTCDVCHGQRFNKETLEIRYKGKNIADVLDMTIEEAAKFFEFIPQIARKMDTLLSVGLGYVKLGQSALTLSGGEAQRVKLALELSKRSTGKTLYILDEPTTGLHFADVKQLMEVIQRLVNQGNTVVMIEHNLDVLLQADYLIDLGPEGGDKGGELVVSGTPEKVAQHGPSYTGQYLKEMLEQRSKRSQRVRKVSSKK